MFDARFIESLYGSRCAIDKKDVFGNCFDSSAFSRARNFKVNEDALAATTALANRSRTTATARLGASETTTASWLSYYGDVHAFCCNAVAQ